MRVGGIVIRVRCKMKYIGNIFAIILVVNALARAVATLHGNASPEHAFKECVVSQPQSKLGYCVGVGALSALHSFDNSPEFHLVDGLTFGRDEKMYRNGYSTVSDSDPGDFRSILDSLGQVFQSRTMRWDMAFLHPGLALRLTPANTGGFLDFVMDQPHPYHQQPQHTLKEVSTGRILARQFLVPMLLGLKFNIATLLPILIGLIALIVSKALVISKIALVISSAISLSSLLFAQPSAHLQQHNPSFIGGGYYSRLPDDEFHDTYRSNTVGAERVESNYSEDQLRLFDGAQKLQSAFRPSAETGVKNAGRNFAWSDADKSKSVD